MAATTLIDRALIRISGEDVRGFLQGLVTNDTSRLDEGPLWAGLLTAQGKALFDFILWTDGPDVLVDCGQGSAEEGAAGREGDGAQLRHGGLSGRMSGDRDREIPPRPPIRPS